MNPPGMLHGKVLRPAAFEAALVSADTQAAEAQEGVRVVRDGNFIGVTAPDAPGASRALEAIRADWRAASQVSNRDLSAHLKGNAQGRPTRQASVEAGLRSADLRLEATYHVAYIAHAPLEPRAAVAEWAGENLTVWTGTQRPFGVRGELARAFGIPESRVRVIVPDTGSAYGGKHTGEAAIEAARLARGADRPVKVVWSREEEFTWAYFRPAGVIDVASGARKDGSITAWEFHNYNSGRAAIQMPYAASAQDVQFFNTRSPLRQGSYRALASVANVFARESHIDELARALRIDPLEFRLKNLQEPRLRAVFEAAAKALGWEGAKPGSGRGIGIAGGTEKGSYVATCAAVEMNAATGRIRIERLVTAFECGAVVNPEHLKSQVEGCVLMGLGGALFEEVEFADGKILNPRFSSYRVPRFSDVPQTDVVLVNRADLPSAGAGETPIIAVAPAIGNAIFAASGARLRSLPMIPDGSKLPPPA